MATPSIERSVTPLRQRMLDDMAMRALGSRTQRDYIRQVRNFAAFLGRSPDTASAEDVRRFQLHQREDGAGAPTINSAVSALRFLFTVTLDRPNLSRRLVLARHPRKLPDVLSVEEVGRLLEAAPGIKYRAALGVAPPNHAVAALPASMTLALLTSVTKLTADPHCISRLETDRMTPQYTSCAASDAQIADGRARSNTSRNPLSP